VAEFIGNLREAAGVSADPSTSAGVGPMANRDSRTGCAVETGALLQWQSLAVRHPDRVKSVCGQLTF